MPSRCTGLILGLVSFACVACEGKTEDGSVSTSVAGGGSSNGGTWSGATSMGGTSNSGGGSNAGGSSSTGSVVTDCEVVSDCALRSASCCGACGSPTADDMIALSVDSLSDYAAQACDSDTVGCPACASMPNPDLFATCDGGDCVAVDLAVSSVTACENADDCVLRAAQCCECGASMELWNLVAIASTAGTAYADMVCEPDQACAECAPVYPTDAVVSCVSGHCSLTR